MRVCSTRAAPIPERLPSETVRAILLFYVTALDTAYLCTQTSLLASVYVPFYISLSFWDAANTFETSLPHTRTTDAINWWRHDSLFRGNTRFVWIVFACGHRKFTVSSLSLSLSLVDSLAPSHNTQSSGSGLLYRNLKESLGSKGARNAVPKCIIKSYQEISRPTTERGGKDATRRKTLSVSQFHEIVANLTNNSFLRFRSARPLSPTIPIVPSPLSLFLSLIALAAVSLARYLPRSIGRSVYCFKRESAPRAKCFPGRLARRLAA